MGKLKTKGFSVKKPTAVSTEENILKSMIQSDKAINEIIPFFDPMLFQSNLGKKIGKWLYDYHVRYGNAPKDFMIDMIESESRKVEDEKEEELLLSFVDKKLREHKEINVDPWIDEARDYFESRRMMALTEDVRSFLKKGDVQAAKTSMFDFNEEALDKNNPNREKFINLMDPEQVDDLHKKHFEERQGGILLTFPKPIGYIIKPIRRRTVTIYQAPPKAGKTFFMFDIMRMASRKGLNCVMFQCGDLYVDQVLERWWTRMTGRPVRFKSDSDDIHGGKVNVKHPVRDCLSNQLGTCPKGGNVNIFEESKEKFLTNDIFKKYSDEHETCTLCFNNKNAPYKYRGSVWWEKDSKSILEGTGPIKKAIRKIEKRIGHKINAHLKCFEMGRATEQDLFTELEILRQEQGYTPDIIGIDYMQALECSDQKLSPRDQSNKKWISGRQIADRFDCGVISVSHTDAGALDSGTQKKSNFSENRRIYDHAADVYAIDQSEPEEALDIIRIRSFYARYAKRNQGVVSIPRCLELGQSMVTGFMGSIYDAKEELEKGDETKKTRGKVKK